MESRIRHTWVLLKIYIRNINGYIVYLTNLDIQQIKKEILLIFLRMCSFMIIVKILNIHIIL